MSKITRMRSQEFYGGLTLEERLVECRTPAISIALIEDYAISEVYTWGLRSRRGRSAVTPCSMFQAGSISKPVFATAVVRLAQQGKLDLDEDVANYLQGYTLPTFDALPRKITLRLLLSHHAGLNLHGFAGYQQDQTIPELVDILRGLPPANNLPLKLIMEPATKWQYSGGGYLLAQKAVADALQLDYHTMLQEQVFQPFGMVHSSYEQLYERQEEQEIVFGYNSYDRQLLDGYNIMPELSAAGLWTTPTDLANFGITIMKSLKGEANPLSLASAQTLTTAVFDFSSYAVGFRVGTSVMGPIFGHGGSNHGYKANAVFCPANGSGFTMMINTDIGSILLGEFERAFTTVMGWNIAE
ncbi:MAG: beta-lactamase family protein [Symbiobacteriaceae bacterium]|nr:beta-lactamase family protein [Symbiobacteriaceae bacterium]